jgi:two-component system, OmpR family, phosphate regulon sensor histidine kinase PhoR
VETNLAPALPAVVFDPDAVAQAVVNLLDNAAKYSGDSKFVGIRLQSEDSAAVFEVEDHGIGIPAEEREKIFQQFYRSRMPSGKGGYGLGLFLVKHIMDAHGGRVDVESEVGRGSRFRLVFPAGTSDL